MKILFKYATRSRRNNFLRGIDSIVNNLANKEDYHILISVDYNDPTMFPLPQLNCNHTYLLGDSENKIHAINRDVNEFDYDWDILVCMSDDMVFVEKGFDETIRKTFYDGLADPYWILPKNLDRFAHFPDGNRSDLCTMSIIGREYYKRDNYIYNPEYKSLFCDDEAQQVAKQRGCYKFVDKVIFNHLHPAYGKAHFDEQYQRTEAIGNSQDRATFIRRQANGFT